MTGGTLATLEPVRRLLALALTLAVALAAAGVASAQETPAPPADPAAAVIPAGVTIGSVPVGGMTADQARIAVQAAFDEPLKFAFGQRRWQATPAQLGAKAYVDGAVTRALQAGIGEWVELVVAIKGADVRTYADYLDDTFSKPAVDTKVRLVKNRPFLTKPKTGVTVRKGDLVRSIVRALRIGQRGPIPFDAEIVEPAVTPQNFGPIVVIRRSSNQLYYYEGRKFVKRFGVATGQAVYPTPLGSFTIVQMWANPWWYPPDSSWAEGAEPIPPGPGNPLGTRWMGISSPAVGIHGTPDPASIGYSASHGCIRMRIPEAEWLFDHVNVGTPVFIVSA